MFEIQYSQAAVKQLKSIAKSDRKLAILILNKIEHYALHSESYANVKILKGNFATFKRIRAGNYRIIFDENNNVMNVYQIKHRKEAYQ